jgi:hypothetical protein
MQKKRATEPFSHDVERILNAVLSDGLLADFEEYGKMLAVSLWKNVQLGIITKEQYLTIRENLLADMEQWKQIKYD